MLFEQMITILIPSVGSVRVGPKEKQMQVFKMNCDNILMFSKKHWENCFLESFDHPCYSSDH